MSGTSLVLDYYDRTHPISVALQKVLEARIKPRPLLLQIGDYLVESTHRRFDDQKSPEGIPWMTDTPAVWVKKKIKKILTESSHLKDSVVYRLSADGVEWGTNKIYGGIHQHGGTISHAERQQVIHFKKGTVDQFANQDDANRHMRLANGKTLHFIRGAGAGFYKASQKASFAMKVTVGAHETDMPARPYLGISRKDEHQIILRVNDYLAMAAGV